MSEMTIGEAIVARLAARGVRRIFGIPGGDCNLDIIEAGQRAGIEFIVTRTESSAAMMASVAAELTGAPGVLMTTRGPGIANAVNGVAYASLDRAPLLVIADTYDPALDYVSHQRFDQAALLRPLTKGESRLNSDDPIGEFEELLDLACAPAPGPVYLEVTGERIRAPAPRTRYAGPKPGNAGHVDQQALAAAQSLLRQSARPIVIVGLQAGTAPTAAALRRLVARWGCPVLTTYRAKGVVSDADSHTLGHYIGGVAEEQAIRAADLILLCGFDPVEGPAAAWRYTAPLIELTDVRLEMPIFETSASLVGDIGAGLDAIAEFKNGTDWTKAELAEAKARIRARAAGHPGAGISPQALVAAAIETLPAGSRITIDAGAHMLPVLHQWETLEARGALISRGLATMGFALPAAVGAAITDPGCPVVAFTGDGGLMMCAGELGTAVQNGLKFIVVVFNDASLAMIAAKQRRRQLPHGGVDLCATDFARIAEGYGCAGYRVEQPDQLRRAFSDALTASVPAVIDVIVNPESYGEYIIALRG